MFHTAIKQIDFEGKNYVKVQDISLDNDMKAVLILSLKDKNLQELLYNKILDVLIDSIHPKNVYKDFSHALENINAFLASWQKKEEGYSPRIHAIIGIYAKQHFYFSTVWRASCYLYNARGEVIEISDKDDNSKDFSFISSWELVRWEVLVLSSIRLLDVLSQDDIKDALKYDTIQYASDIIETILSREYSWKNIGTLMLQKQGEHMPSQFSHLGEKYKYYFFKCLDNKLVKKGISYAYIVRDIILKQWEKRKQIIFWAGVVLGTYLLFSIVSWFFQITSGWVGAEEAKQKLLGAQEYIVTASENINNPDAFEYNIEQAQVYIDEILSQNLYLDDIEKLQNDISLLQKKMNGIEIFSVGNDDIIADFSQEIELVDMVDIRQKKYIVGTKQVIGPLVSGETANIYTPSAEIRNEVFVAATSQDDAVLIMTQSGKILRFSWDSFWYVDVINQSVWEFSPVIENYARNIYTLSKEQNQIYMHRKNWDNYEAAVPYLSDEDAIATGRILDLAIDGGIYILKLDGSMLKLFRSPSYRLESLSLNNLPKNYDFSNIQKDTVPKIFTQANLKYVYMLLDNRILIFEPNTLRFQDVKSLTYVGQIEGQNRKIQEFYIENDGEIFIADEAWVFKIEVKVLEDRILIQ